MAGFARLRVSVTFSRIHGQTRDSTRFAHARRHTHSVAAASQIQGQIGQWGQSALPPTDAAQAHRLTTMGITKPPPVPLNVFLTLPCSLRGPLIHKLLH